MAVEQDWAAYADQAFLATTDTLLARTAAGAGVEVPGAAIAAQRSPGGNFTAGAAMDIGGSASIPHAQYFFTPFNGSTNTATVRSGVQLDGTAGALNFLGLGTLRYQMNTAAFLPGGDNSYTLGTPSGRWSIVYAATGTINTSDERDKVWRGALTEAERRAAQRIIGELGFFQWRDAVAEKGDDARWHFGARAQRVWAIMADEGLVDPIGEDGRPGKTPYAFLCYDEWDATDPVPATPAVIDDATGEVIRPAIAEIPARPAGNRFGLRTGDLALFLIAALLA